MPTLASTPPAATSTRPAGIRRAGGAMALVLAPVGGLLGLLGGGCAPSRDAAYERILRGEITVAAPAADRFTTAFPEHAAIDLASADAAN